MQRAAFTIVEPRSTALRPLNYTHEVERLRKTRGSTVRLGSLLRAVGPAYGTVFTRIDCAPEHGVELLSQSDMFAAEPAGRVIRVDSLAKPERHLVRKWQVLIAGAGTLGENELYGRSLVADGGLVGKYVGPDALVLDFAEPGSDISLYSYAFLSSQMGLKAVRSASYGTKVLRLRTDIISSLPVPMPDGVTVARVAALVRQSVQERERYLTSVLKARASVEALPEMRDARELCARRRRRAVLSAPPLRTLSAWNHASDGGAAALLRHRSPSTVGDFVQENQVFRGNRHARVDCAAPYGVQMASQRDLFLRRPVPRRVVRPAASDADLYIPSGSLAIANAGTLNEGELFGRVMYVSEMFSGMAFSELILRLLPERGSEILYAFLSTSVGFRMLRATAFGSKLLYLRPRFIREIPVPEIDDSLANIISRLVRQAFAAKDRALRAESDAVRIIEEEVLPQWLA